MKALIYVLVVLFCLPVLAMENTIENVTEYYSENCMECHGGELSTSLTPIINGLNKTYLRKQLKAFQKGKREDTVYSGIMNDLSLELSRTDMVKLGKYIANLNPCDAPQNKTNHTYDIKIGEQKAISCKSCHSVDSHSGSGPSLIGQKVDYLIHAMNTFKDQTRKNPIMEAQITGLSDEDIANISAYYNSLGSCEE